MSDKMKEMLDEVTFVTQEEGLAWREEFATVTDIRDASSGQKHVTLAHPLTGPYTKVYLSREQADHLRDPDDENQSYPVILVCDKLRPDKTGENLYDYYWKVRSFDGVENSKVKPLESDGLNALFNETHEPIKKVPATSNVADAKATNGVGKTSAFNDRQNDIILGMIYKSMVDIKIATGRDTEGLTGSMFELIPATKSMYEKYQQLRKELGLTE